MTSFQRSSSSNSNRPGRGGAPTRTTTASASGQDPVHRPEGQNDLERDLDLCSVGSSDLVTALQNHQQQQGGTKSSSNHLMAFDLFEACLALREFFALRENILTLERQTLEMKPMYRDWFSNILGTWIYIVSEKVSIFPLLSSSASNFGLAFRNRVQKEVSRIIAPIRARKTRCIISAFDF